ncbi:Pyridine nucleotide-disulfide oxidoreductase [Planctomycetales bacterium 10988]|nr:Pyridine nucleotide-disulfide oxidoreductase [Planctomycetales bacterium 10988]
MNYQNERPLLTNRRSFLRVIGGVGLTSAIAPGYAFGFSSKKQAASGILIEASNFENLGGWKLDTQHYQQMGGCYLLAHGMGEPVENATTTVEVPEAGTWHVWVRTRDWCKGNWKSPGQFRVHVNGSPLDSTFGVEEETWHWQSGGSIEISSAGKVEIAVQDLTGFDGRFDAIYLSQASSPALPNDDLVELTGWKDQLSGRVAQPIREESFDVVIVGGGMSGCGAALAARSQGLKVALIQDRPIFGGNASEEIRVHTLGIHGHGGNILEKIDTEHYPNGDALAKEDQKKREASMAASGVDLYPGHIACGLEKKDNKITSVEARNAQTGIITRFTAPVFIDATGDGWLGFWGGAEFRYGREAHTEFNEAWDKHGDLWSPEVADHRVMGTSVLWNAEQDNQRHFFPEVPWAKPVAKEHAATAGEWYWEYSDNDLDQVKDAEKIRDHMLRAIYGTFANAKMHPKNATWKLKWVSYVGGKRESRRLIGDYIYSMRDATERREFEDAVVVEERDVDTHYQRKLTGEPVDFLSKALFYDTGGQYFVPFRTLYSKDIDNLMMAGRCFSCSHIGLAGPRVMNACGQMGIATGYAAALCNKHHATPREVGKTHIHELRQLIGFEEAQS